MKLISLLFLILLPIKVNAQGLLLFGAGTSAANNGPLVVNTWNATDCGSDSDLITLALAATCTETANPLTWSSSTVDPPLDWSIEDNPCGGVAAPLVLPRTISVNSVVYTARTTTKVWQKNLELTVGSLIASATTSSKNLVSSGWVCTNAFRNEGSNDNWTMLLSAAGVGRSCAFQINDASGITLESYRAHSSGGTPTRIVVGSAGNNTWYRFKLLHDGVNGQCIFRLYSITGEEISGSPSTGGTILTGVDVAAYQYEGGDSIGTVGDRAWITGVVVCFSNACTTADSTNFMNLVP